MGTVGARHLMADALDVRHRLPRLWARVEANEVLELYKSDATVSIAGLSRHPHAA